MILFYQIYLLCSLLFWFLFLFSFSLIVFVSFSLFRNQWLLFIFILEFHRFFPSRFKLLQWIEFHIFSHLHNNSSILHAQCTPRLWHKPCYSICFMENSSFTLKCLPLRKGHIISNSLKNKIRWMFAVW